METHDSGSLDFQQALPEDEQLQGSIRKTARVRGGALRHDRLGVRPAFKKRGGRQLNNPGDGGIFKKGDSGNPHRGLTGGRGSVARKAHQAERAGMQARGRRVARNRV